MPRPSNFWWYEEIASHRDASRREGAAFHQRSRCSMSSFAGRLVPHQMAEVNKIFLIGLFLVGSDALPLADEVLRCTWNLRKFLCSILQENGLAVDHDVVAGKTAWRCNNAARTSD